MNLDLVDILFIVLVNVISIFFANYLQKKGSNLADKEDIESLTKLVEGVKQENIKEIALINKNISTELAVLSSNLSFLADKKKQIFSISTQAIIDYSIQLNSWTWIIQSVNFQDFEIASNEIIRDKRKQLSDFFTNNQIELSKLKIFIRNDDVLEKAFKASQIALEANHVALRMLFLLDQQVSSRKIWTETYLEKSKTNFRNKDDEEISFFRKKALDIEKEVEAIKEEFKINKGESMSRLIKAVEEFNLSAREIIK